MFDSFDYRDYTLNLKYTAFKWMLDKIIQQNNNNRQKIQVILLFLKRILESIIRKFSSVTNIIMTHMTFQI